LIERIETWILGLLAGGGRQAREIAFERIWRLYHRRILFFVRQWSAHEAEDLTQEIMLKVFQGLDRFNPVYSFSTWIYAIARYHCISHFTKKRPQVRAGFDAADSSVHFREPDDPETKLLDGERDRLIESVLGTLDPDSREMAFLKYYEGLKTRQIAVVFGLPEGTVKSRLHAIREKIKEGLRSHED
jgi:RNA polymerase sigma-70 factor (ECF subfamily)